MSRTTLILAGLFAVSMGLLTWSGLEYLGKRQSAQDARENLEKCRILAQQIEQLRGSDRKSVV